MSSTDSAGGFGQAQLASISAGVASLLSAANTGGFAINESGGQALKAAIQKMIDELDGLANDMATIDQEPKLGSSPGATVTKPFVRTVASGDNQSFIPTLKEFEASLTQALQAIEKAMQNYQANEQHQTNALGNIH